MRWQWLGRVEYADAVARMEALRARILDGDEEAETLLLCEHAPVITLGRRARAEHVVASATALAARGVTVAQSSRGGDVTYHGPGQLVAYPVMRLATGVVDHVCRLSKAAIAVAADFGIEARFDRARPGVWAADAKLAAVGVHVHRRVAIHGLALNVTTALDAFDLIVPCGLRDIQVTSIAALSGRSPMLPDVAAAFAHAFAALHSRTACSVGDQPLQLHSSSVE
ncbi:MAG: Lipoyl(octanoyl) transferase [bacterium]|nr:Lipoyl(octanoyl) transferase [bacterium]